MANNYFQLTFSKNLCIFILILSLFNSCTEPPDPKKVNHGFTTQITDVKTYQMVDLKLNKKLIENKYSGKFGEIPVDLIKTSDSTLTFFVPDVKEGSHELDFELAIIDFEVTKTPDVNPDKILENIFKSFDADVSKLPTSTDEDIAFVANINIYKENVLKVFNSLTEEQKKQTALIIEANNDVFKGLTTDLITNIDTSIKFRTTGVTKQSECARTDYKSYYDCTASNMANAYNALKKPTQEVITLVAFVGGLGYGAIKGLSAFGPAAIGITAVGLSLPASLAVYIFFMEVVPAVRLLGVHTFDLLKTPWIFRKELFDKMNTSFSSNSVEDLELEPEFKTLEESDGGVTKNTGVFINVFNGFKSLWSKIPTDITIPSFMKKIEDTELNTNEVVISGISNSNIKLVKQEGQKVTFNATKATGKEENFNFHLTVKKQGFVEEKTINAKLLPKFDSTEIYKAAVLGWWSVTHYDPNNPTKTQRFQLFKDGTGVYPKDANPNMGYQRDYAIKWTVTKTARGYELREYGFWHFAYNDESIVKNSRLNYPVTGFKKYSRAGGLPDFTFLNQEYIKN